MYRSDFGFQHIPNQHKKQISTNHSPASNTAYEKNLEGRGVPLLSALKQQTNDTDRHDSTCSLQISLKDSAILPAKNVTYCCLSD